MRGLPWTDREIWKRVVSVSEGLGNGMVVGRVLAWAIDGETSQRKSRASGMARIRVSCGEGCHAGGSAVPAERAYEERSKSDSWCSANE